VPFYVANRSPSTTRDDLLMTPVLTGLGSSDLWSRKLPTETWDHPTSSISNQDRDSSLGISLDSEICLRSPCAGNSLKRPTSNVFLLLLNDINETNKFKIFFIKMSND